MQHANVKATGTATSRLVPQVKSTIHRQKRGGAMWERKCVSGVQGGVQVFPWEQLRRLQFDFLVWLQNMGVLLLHTTQLFSFRRFAGLTDGAILKPNH